MSDPRTDDPSAGFDKGTGDPNDDRAFLDDLPPAQAEDDADAADGAEDVDSDETDADA
ncbi:hypothetical protein [Microbacterium abyssi]|uniref:hypothetical protein n=1 Tax=Microbacterium abyssi TaxID=2782166 RepID=UPI0018872622|nr:hypothetical protein [Microbacterium sp. A18JL241]